MYISGYRENNMADSGFWKGLGRGIEKLGSWVPHTTQQEKRNARTQMDMYHQEKQRLSDENARISEQKHQEQTRIQEKQIRAMRRNFRTPGFLEGPNTGTSDQLG